LPSVLAAFLSERLIATPVAAQLSAGRAIFMVGQPSPNPSRAVRSRVRLTTFPGLVAHPYNLQERGILMMIENLENRRLLSASLANGVLTVTGTTGNDRIAVTPNGTDLNVQIGKTKQTFKAADVKSLVVKSLAGNDTIDLAKSPVGATVDAGDGNDLVIGTALADVVTAGKGNDYVFSLAGNDSVTGGDGNDQIASGAGNDLVAGGTGNDLISAGDGNDSVTGDAGNDLISGGAGNDTLHGNAGNDVILGDAGDDQIFGEAGNDRLFGGKGNDKVDGGDGKDVAGKEGTDTFTKVEKIWR
jgi:Ca2+-binding RTX toxin-like protein